MLDEPDHDSAQSAEIARLQDKRSISNQQFEAVKVAAKRDKVDFEAEPSEGAPDSIWLKNYILVGGDVDIENNEQLQALGAKLAPNLDHTEQQLWPHQAKLVRLNLPDEDGRSTREIVEDLNKPRDRDDLSGKVWLDNLMYVSVVNICPADEPVPVRPFPATIPYPPPSGDSAGCGVRILVIDTGLSPGWEINHPWLYDPKHLPADVTGDIEYQTLMSDGTIGQDAGHGTFIAGVIRCVAPRADVSVSNTMRWAGAIDEARVADRIMMALQDKQPPDIISLSAGCTTLIDLAAQETNVGKPPQKMLDVMHRLQRPGCHTLLVAAAGNDGGVGPFYPASFAGVDPFVDEDVVVSVGALREDRRGRACF